MLVYDDFINNSKAFNMVKLDAERERFCHAYMFVHKDENFLLKFCEKVSKLFINLNEKDKQENNNLKIEKHIHPDVLFYGENSSINVEDVSNIVEASQVTPFEADKKIFVLLHAENMNEASQNKILKTIEEPPKNTYYIIACTGLSRILQTIKSRVKMIELDELSAFDIQKMLTDSGISDNKAQIFATCSNGNGSFAEKLATDDDFIEFFNQIVSCFYDIKGSRDVLRYSNIFNSKNVDKKEFLDVFMMIARDISMILAGKEELVSLKNILSKLKVIANTLSYEATNILIKTCIESQEKLFFNVNGTSVVDGMLFKLAEVKVKCRKL